MDGEPAEFKRPEPGATSGTMRNGANMSKRRGGQARYLIFDLRQSGMTEAEAKRGIARIKGAYSTYFDRVRAFGNGFDVTVEVGP